ncbi:MAG: PQQ-dependent sugar dehydrogenase [Acidimicrobiia bacterium]
MRRLIGLALVAAVVFAALGSASSAPAQEVTTNATFEPGLTDTVVASALGAPTSVVALPDGRMLVTSQEGKLWVVATNGSTSVALDLAALTKVCASSEMGLLGVTIDPQFATNGWIYLFYTARLNDCALNGANANGAKNRVSRFTMSGSTVNAATELVLLDNMPEWGGNHNGGDVRVANDGMLYVSVGDGGSGSPLTNPGDLSLPNGKILRINRDGSIPAGNPNGTTVCKTTWGPPLASKVCGEIWADGLRNPFRLGFDVTAPGAKFRINDVGSGTWEEVDEGIAGAHYGWPCREGPAAGTNTTCRTPFTDPVLSYDHSQGCDVETGGAFVPAGTWGANAGSYLLVDFGCGRLWLSPPGEVGAPQRVLATGMQNTTDLEFFDVGAGQTLFYTTYAGGGQLHRVTGAPAAPPIPEIGRWYPLGGQGLVASGPAVAAWSPGRLDVFVRGTDGQLWHKWYDQGWSGWEPLGGAITAGPAVAAWSQGRLDVFVRGTDGQLWHKWYNNGWSGWEPLGGAITDGPAVAAWSAGRLDVFVRGTDGQLWHKWYNNGWSGWEPLGGVMTDGPAVAAWSQGRLDVFVRGTDGQLWHKWYDNGWSGWEPLGGALAGGPAAASWSPGRIDVAARGIDNALLHKWFSNGWSGWETLSGSMTDRPGTSSWGAGRLDFLVRGSDGQLWHKWYDNGWNA